MQADIDHIGAASARFDGIDVRRSIDDSLAVQEPGGEPFVVAGRPHGRSKRCGLRSQGGVVQLKFQRRFDCNPIVLIDARVERCAQHAYRSGYRWPPCGFGGGAGCKSAVLMVAKFCSKPCPMIPFAAPAAHF